MEFNPARHDGGDKQLLGLREGLGEIDQVLDMLARHPATARFVSRKLAQAFVADARRPPWSSAWRSVGSRPTGAWPR
jgi:uncharacterized protein (DUF1800 family)